jgi:hypothetical protein
MTRDQKGRARRYASTAVLPGCVATDHGTQAPQQRDVDSQYPGQGGQEAVPTEEMEEEVQRPNDPEGRDCHESPHEKTDTQRLGRVGLGAGPADESAYERSRPDGYEVDYGNDGEAQGDGETDERSLEQ